MQSGKSVVGVEHGIGILSPQVIFYILAGQGCAPADHRKLQALPLQILDHIFHFQRGLHQQPAQSDGIGFVLHRRFDDRIRRLLDPEVHYSVAIVGQNDVHQIFANIMNITLHRGYHDSSFLRSSLLLHLGLEISHSLLHHRRGIKHRRQLHLARTKKFAYRAHSVQQYCIDQIQRRVLPQCVFQQRFQRLSLCAFAHRFLPVDNGVLQLVVHRKRFHMGRGGCLRFAFRPRKVLHVFLQRVAVGFIAINQLAGKLNLFMRNLVQRIDLSVIDNSHVQAIVDRLVHEHAIQHPPWINIQTKRNVADPKDCLHFRQFLLDAFYRL